MSPAPVFVRIPGSHHPGTRLRLVPGFRDPGSVLILGQVSQYGNPYLICITAHGSVSNEPGSVTWLATKYLKTVSWRNHTEKLTTMWPQNISFRPKFNILSSYFTILMLNCLENTPKLQFDNYVTAVKFLTSLILKTTWHDLIPTLLESV